MTIIEKYKIICLTDFYSERGIINIIDMNSKLGYSVYQDDHDTYEDAKEEVKRILTNNDLLLTIIKVYYKIYI